MARRVQAARFKRKTKMYRPPAAIRARARKARQLILQFEKSRFGRQRSAFEKDEYRSIRDELAWAIHEELRKNVHWQKRFTARPRRPAQIRQRTLRRGGSVSTIALDLATAACNYQSEVASSVRQPRARGRPSYFASPAVKALLRACVTIYDSHLTMLRPAGGKRPFGARAGDSNYSGEFQVMVRAVLKALENAAGILGPIDTSFPAPELRPVARPSASRAKRSLTDALAKAIRDAHARLLTVR